jgi:FkbM family methyltransferase
VPDVYDLLTRSDHVNRLVHRAPPLLALANATPLPVQFSDGRRRLASFRLARLTRTWHPYPEERRRSYDLYAGGDVLDLGAYHGWYSVLLAPKARPGDRFVSCEPDPGAYRELLQNLAALADIFPELMLLPVPQPFGDGRPVVVSHPEGSGHPQFGSAGVEAGPATSTVDEFVADFDLRPSYVKVDVEGAEYFVLRGMERTLRDLRPRVMLEVHPLWQPEGVTVADTERLLLDQGYSRIDEHADQLAVRQWWQPGDG